MRPSPQTWLSCLMTVTYLSALGLFGVGMAELL
ncbi:hypothetical protein SYYSPA8_19435 [Streptomyces yaizuensis]|uniref:Uncharacterized protein n=1 Tax=Streptomyces yaizuensis TaxID=2989713 RepID=A0ABQ5P1N1_9ACTN|nr:hypothetical protein SYYSPA8_19435 [Streptomyces sp. YSPA8]